MLFPVRGKMDINALIIEESDADFNKKKEVKLNRITTVQFQKQQTTLKRNLLSLIAL